MKSDRNGRKMRLMNVQNVASWRLCSGCGACLYICPKDNVRLVDLASDGIRPLITDAQICNGCRECISVCPGCGDCGFGDNATVEDAKSNILRKRWGNVLEIWEGYANEQSIRWHGSSGGVATAVTLYVIEREKFYGALHTASVYENGCRNVTEISRRREELTAGTGSKYSPASPCDSLARIEEASDPCVFIGKGCDVQALINAEKLRLPLAEKVGLAIGIFCAGTPSTQGTLDLLENHNIDLSDVEEIRYRGKGWPGKMKVTLKGRKKPSLELSYQASWGFLQKYRPFRCYLCPDGTSELADISCGDAWFKKPKDGDPGRSLVLVRTERGRRILHAAMEAGYVQLEKVEAEALEESQINLLNKKRTIWGRLLAMKMFGVPAPKYSGFHLYENWLELPFKEKMRSILGTARRIVQRRYHRSDKALGVTQEGAGDTSLNIK